MITRKWQVIIGSLLVVIALILEVLYFAYDLRKVPIGKNEIKKEVEKFFPVSTNYSVANISFVDIKVDDFKVGEEMEVRLSILTKIRINSDHNLKGWIIVVGNLRYNNKIRKFVLVPQLVASGSLLAETEESKKLSDKIFVFVNDLLGKIEFLSLESGHRPLFKKASKVSDKYYILTTSRWGGGEFLLLFIIFSTVILGFLNAHWISTLINKKEKKKISDRKII